ncbi:double-CXXCG motif protein [Myxococcus hansupus]|uniref:SitI6 family double-CXXCG motif immunity protein n=1 Tax=Pseudomyxococcus hansupus TaxID=1297742 RepID=UPI0005D1260A|nr:double-CXXCG motif protein [Myxococcus hansupus]
MTRFFWLREDEAATSAFSGAFNAVHKWSLPGVTCSDCGATWSSWGCHYPCVDLSKLPERAEFERARPEPYPEFARLRERVRPLAPVNAVLPPGAAFGPLMGTASGEFGPFTWQGTSLLLVRRDALERLQATGVHGLVGARTELRFRKKDPPELMDLQLEPHGLLHRDCIPSDTPPPCETCGRRAFDRPEEPVLDAASLPSDVDIFRLANFTTMIVGTDRFVDAVKRLGLPGLSAEELPVR